MKTKVMLKMLHTNYNVISSKYNGFFWELRLQHRIEDVVISLKGDSVDKWIGFDDTKGNDIPPDGSSMSYKFARKLAKRINKRVGRYKDPFKDITGW